MNLSAEIVVMWQRPGGNKRVEKGNRIERDRESVKGFPIIML